MNKTKSREHLVGRRAELMAQLFLEDLEPAFLADTAQEFGFDFLVGFTNPQGGINLTAVEVKSTDQPVVPGHFSILWRLYYRWAHSNIPILLLVIDVKQNRVYFAWPTQDGSNGSTATNTISIRLTEIDEKNKSELREKLAG